MICAQIKIRYEATLIGFFRARVVDLQPVTITRDIHFKQRENETWANDIKVKNSNGEYLGQVEYKIRNILEPMMIRNQWTMLLNVEFDHLNIDKILVVKVEVLLWNQVGVEQVVQSMKLLESLKYINNPID